MPARSHGMRTGELEDREAAVQGRICSGLIGNDLDGDIRETGYFDYMIQLSLHDQRATDNSAQRRLVYDYPQPRRIVLGEQALALQPHGHSLLNPLGAGIRHGAFYNAARIFCRLHETRHCRSVKDID